MRNLRFVTLLSALPFAAYSQAFLSPQGEGSVSILYQYSIDRLHAFSDGSTRYLKHWASITPINLWGVTDQWRHAPVAE